MFARGGRLLLAGAALAAIALAGCGGGDDVDVGPAAAVPADTPIYLEATVRPEGEVKSGAEAALGKILDTDDPGAKLQSLIERETTQHLKPGEQFTFAEDIDLWLGERAAVFFSSFEEDSDGTLVIESRDNEAALNAFREDTRVTGQTGEYEGHTYEFQTEDDGGATVFGPVGDFMVVGSEEGFKQAVDASDGDNLGGSDDFKDSVGDLPDDSLGILYSIPRQFLEAIPEEEVDPFARNIIETAAEDSLDEPVVGDLTASAEDLELDVTAGGEGVETAESSLIGELPAQAWLAIGFGDVGETVRRTIEQLREAGVPGLDQGLEQVESTAGVSLDELTGALGDAALYVQGTSEAALTGALVVQTNDSELTGRLVEQLRGLIQLGSPRGVQSLSTPGGGSGLRINDPSTAPQPVELLQEGDRLVIGYGAGSAQAALQPAQNLVGSPGFTAAQEKLSGLGTDFFLDFAPVFELAENEGARGDPEFREAKPYIDGLDYLAVGSGDEDDRAQIRLLVGLK
ncbi:MAG: DUF3352 domain-containing protein [Solirubrobacterales bacterium]